MQDSRKIAEQPEGVMQKASSCTRGDSVEVHTSLTVQIFLSHSFFS